MSLKDDFLRLTSVGLLGVCLLVVGLRFYRAIRSPLRKVPGPFWARFTRLWFLREVYHGRFHFSDVELHRKYGMFSL